MAGKTFRRAVRSAEAKIWFEVETESGKVVRFNCNDSMPGGIVLAFAGESTAPEPGIEAPEAKLRRQGSAGVRAAMDLFNAAIVKAQQTLFWAMVNGEEDAPGVIDVDMMFGIAEMLAGEYSERPTGESSEPGQPKNSSGSPSTDGASPAVVTYSRSTPVDAST